MFFLLTTLLGWELWVACLVVQLPGEQIVQWTRKLHAWHALLDDTCIPHPRGWVRVQVCSKLWNTSFMSLGRPTLEISQDSRRFWPWALRLVDFIGIPNDGTSIPILLSYSSTPKRNPIWRLWEGGSHYWSSKLERNKWNKCRLFDSWLQHDGQNVHGRVQRM